MRVKVKNNGDGPFGVERVDGRYTFVRPGHEKTVDAAAPGRLYELDFLDVEAIDTEVPPLPDGLKEQAKAATFTGFLDRAAPKIIADLPKQSAEDLGAILADEQRGKSRKGVVAAVEAEIAARAP